MIPGASILTRAGFAATLALLALAATTREPVSALVPLALPGLRLAGAAVLLGVAAALLGQRRPAAPVLRLAAIALGSVAALLAVWVALRPAAGMRALVTDVAGVQTVGPTGTIDIQGRDLVPLLGPVRIEQVSWSGALRVPRSGTYRISVEGRGRVTISMDGRSVLEAEGEILRTERTVGLTEGTHRIEVSARPHGPGLRLRLGWTRPGPLGPSDEWTIPTRFLGPPLAVWWWIVGDLLCLALAILVGLVAFLARWEVPRDVPAPSRLGGRELVTSAAGLLVVLALMSWPLVRDPVHLGMTHRPDGRLNTWILAWGGYALVHQPTRIFQAPVLHPLPDAFAFSENLLLGAALVAPVSLAGQPVLAYNLVLIGSMLASGLATQALVRRASGDRFAAFVAGACFAAGAHRWIRLAHLHAQMTLFLPLALVALDRFWERRTLRRGLAVGVLLGLQGLASVYLGAITAATLATATALALVVGLRGREATRLLAGFALAAALLAPVVAPYLRMRAFEGEEFGLETIAAYAATPESWAASGTRLWGGVTRHLVDVDRLRDTLFPGLTLLGLGVVGLASAPRRFRAVAVAASCVAFVFSLGPETALYRFLHEHLVLIRGVRALARFSLVPVLALCVLTGIALAGRRLWLQLLALVLVMAESANFPLTFARYEGPPAYARWLAGRPGAVAVLPLGERDTEVMLDGIAHYRPLMNGDSGFMPRPYSRAMELLGVPLEEESLRFLRAIGVKDVVSRGELGLPSVAVLEGERIAEVPQGPVAAEVGRGRPVAERVMGRDIVIDLGEVREVRGVSFEVSDAPWLAVPRVEASTDGRTFDGLGGRASLADAVLSLYRNPRRGRGAVVFPARAMRWLRLESSLPAWPGTLEVLE